MLYTLVLAHVSRWHGIIVRALATQSSQSRPAARLKSGVGMRSMKVRDYNGTGKWASEAIVSRYLEHAAKAGVQEPIHLKPLELVRGNKRWIYPLMDQIITGIHTGDPACMVIGVEFLEEDHKFPFGANLKSRTARALRQTEVSPALAERLRRRIVSMLVEGNVPREYREYAKLLRKIGFDNWWPRLIEQVPKDNPHSMRYFNYFLLVHEHSPAVVADHARQHVN
jgi:hypothetical protein